MSDAMKLLSSIALRELQIDALTMQFMKRGRLYVHKSPQTAFDFDRLDRARSKRELRRRRELGDLTLITRRAS